ncbi:MAG: DUF3526 domain-containing protein [Bacteroidota bacterium]
MRLSIRLEAGLLLRTRLFVVLAGVVVLLSALAGAQGGQLARAQADAIEAARALEVERDAEALVRAEQIRSGEIDPPWWQSPLNVQAWSYSLIRHVALPPGDLAGVAIADADIQPFLFRINPHPPDRWSNRASERTPSVAAYGGFDLADVVLLLTPLLVIVAVASVIRDRNGSERQRLAVVQAGSERTLLLQRLVPRALVVLAIILAAGLAGVVATRPPLTAETAAGTVTILLTFGAHALFWIALAAGLILAVRPAVATFAGFVSLWFILGVLAPGAVEGMARIVSPPPSPLSVFASERAETVRARMLEEDLTRAYAARDSLARDMLLEALDEDRLLITPTNLLVQDEVDRRRAEDRDMERHARSQFTGLAQTLSSLSPTLLARRVIYAQAGRGEARRRAFEAQVAAYHGDLQDTFVPLLMRRATRDAVLLPEPFAFQEP